MAPQEELAKAQDLFSKMVGACGPKCFHKLFTTAISRHTIYEFYPVVVRAELSAALALSAKAKAKAQETGNAFDLYDYLNASFGLTPRHLLRLQTRAFADVMGRPLTDVEEMLKSLSFTLRDGTIIGHPDLRRRPAPRAFSPRVRILREQPEFQ